MPATKNAGKLRIARRLASEEFTVHHATPETVAPTPTLTEYTRHGKVTRPVFLCNHHVRWTECTICSKPRSKP